MRSAVLALVLAACYSPAAPSNVPCGPGGECPSGQVCVAGVCGGDSTIDATRIDDGSVVADDATDAPPDAMNACAGGDDRCLVSCVADDPDCMTTCGDNRCVGNAGELCTSCAADCQTRNAVCGNAQCEVGESPDCFADCGPSPWTWTAMEADLIARINAKRTGGTACGNNVPTTAPALTASDALRPAAHEWAWEIAHHEFSADTGMACNGRTFSERQVPADFDAAVWSSGYDSLDMLMTGWFANTSICQLLMATTRTQIAAGIALDTDRGYVVVLE